MTISGPIRPSGIGILLIVGALLTPSDASAATMSSSLPPDFHRLGDVTITYGYPIPNRMIVTISGATGEVMQASSFRSDTLRHRIVQTLDRQRLLEAITCFYECHFFLYPDTVVAGPYCFPDADSTGTMTTTCRTSADLRYFSFRFRVGTWEKNVLLVAGVSEAIPKDLAELRRRLEEIQTPVWMTGE